MIKVVWELGGILPPNNRVTPGAAHTSARLFLAPTQSADGQGRSGRPALNTPRFKINHLRWMDSGLKKTLADFFLFALRA